MENSLSLAAKISALINSDSGVPQSRSSEDEKFSKEYETAFNNLDSSAQLLAFRNIIRADIPCGLANAGAYQYLLNTDGTKRYRVTIRIYWRQGFEGGQYDQILIIEAGGRLSLGCTDSGHIPTTYYQREVVGEVAI